MTDSHTCNFSVPTDHPALPGHFPGQPVVPAALLCDLLCRQLEARLQVPLASLQQLRFLAPVQPGETLTLHCQARDAGRWRFSVQQSLQQPREVCKGTAAARPGDSAVPAPQDPEGTWQPTSELYDRLPHSGGMCLLEQVNIAQTDRLLGRSQLNSAHPLLHLGQLSGWCALEHAAQLLACQGAAATATVSQTRIVVARQLHCHRPAVSATGQSLLVQTEIVSRQSNAISARFRLDSSATLLASGEFVVMFQP